MSSKPLIELLEKLLKLHKSLTQVASEKTEVLKKGDVEALNTLMKNEQTHINAIRLIEQQRVKTLAKLLPGEKDPTLRDCLPLFEESVQQEVITLQEKLVQQIDQLKAANDLNQQLLEQSLQFVMLNLDLFLPENMPNYSKENEEPSTNSNLSLFDSKA